MIALKVDLKGITALRGRNIERAMVKALRKAGATALRDMRAEAAKLVRTRKAMKAGTVRKALKMVNAKGSNIDRLSWTLLVSGKPVPLSAYPVRQTKKGVSAQINKGARKLIKGAFIATMASGHKGVFLRKGKKRLPIRELFSSNVAESLSGEGEAEAILIRGRRTLEDGVRRLFPLELEKLKK